MSEAVLQTGDLICVPSIHGRVTFAEEVRRRFFRYAPAVVAVELPASLRPAVLEGVARLPALTAVCFREAAAAEARLCYVPIDPCDAMIEAIRLAVEHGVALAFVDRDVVDYQEEHFVLPCDYVSDRAGYDAYCERLWSFLTAFPVSPVDDRRERHAAALVRALSGEWGRVLWVGGFRHWPGVVRYFREGATSTGGGDEEAGNAAGGATLAWLSPKSQWQALGEIPYVAYLYECAREGERLDGPEGFPKLEAVRAVFLEAEKRYETTCKETINLTQWRALMQYTRNLALVNGRYRPDLYAVVMAAKSVVDGDFGAETREIATSYPYNERQRDLPTLSLYRDRAKLGERRYRSKPRWPEPESDVVKIRFKRRSSKEERDLWEALWRFFPRFGICSWPPEDERQERFMDFVRKRALRTISEDHSRVEEFTTSFLDGLDVRETMRNWHTGKLYVRETPPPRGRVGPVVIIWRDEPMSYEGSWRETLYAEHNNESDVAFYADPLGEDLVGPGICRTRLNGILSVFPACHIRDPWENPVIGDYELCSEKLLAAAILYSEMPYVAYVAPRPPARRLRVLAAANDRRIVYLPIHVFSKKTLKEIRRFHVLDGHHVRRYAAEYID